ncbi:hypothetical protein ACS0TY_016907 [Phlomoides rotata]
MNETRGLSPPGHRVPHLSGRPGFDSLWERIGELGDIRYVSVEEQVAIFISVLSHHSKPNRTPALPQRFKGCSYFTRHSPCDTNTSRR